MSAASITRWCLQSQRDGACHECDRGEVLAQPIMQFLAQPLLLPIAYREDFSLQPFAPADFRFQLFV